MCKCFLMNEFGMNELCVIHSLIHLKFIHYHLLICYKYNNRRLRGFVQA